MSESYQEIRDSFKWDRPKKFNFARDVIDKWAAQDNQKMAMLWVDDAGLEKRIRELCIIPNKSPKNVKIQST